MRTDLPVLATAAAAWQLLWRQRFLHAKAIWPPVVFLVAAEFIYHRVEGNADTWSARWHALQGAHWYMPAAAGVCWLIGLKFLLSFSISWRRHLLLAEKFDPFFFRAPFWRYLGFLLLTYAWALPALLVAVAVAFVVAAGHPGPGARLAAPAIVIAALVPILWAIVRQVPFFTVLALDPPRPAWRDSVAAMRGQTLRYAAAWVLAMLPVALLDLALDQTLTHLGADRHAVSTALGQSAVRQAMLFTHFSLGASIGALTATTVGVLPRTRPTTGTSDPLGSVVRVRGRRPRGSSGAKPLA